MASYPRASLPGLPQELLDQILDDIPYARDDTFALGGVLPVCALAVPPPICHVNQRLRLEAIPRYYSANIFSVDLMRKYKKGTGLSDFRRWVQGGILGADVQFLRRLELRGAIKILPSLRSCIEIQLSALCDLHAGNVVFSILNRFDQGWARLGRVQDVQDGIKKLVKTRDGKPFGVLELEELVEGFNRMCIGDY